MQFDANMKPSRICLVTGGPLVASPRVVKEADSLQDSGFEITVITHQTLMWQSMLDKELLRQKPWSARAVEAHNFSWIQRLKMRNLRRQNAARVLDGDLRPDVLVKAFAPWVDLCLPWIRNSRPDCLIGHTLPGIAVAYVVHRLWNIPFGIDLEDYHPGENPGGEKSMESRLATELLKQALPYARYVTTASPPIAQEVSRRFGSVNVQPVLNAFDATRGWHTSNTGRLAMYWFSQTIGPSRGIEDAIEACTYLRGEFELTLQGYLLSEFGRLLRKKIRAAGLEGRIHFRPWCPPDRLITEAAHYEVGLALEPALTLNSDLCVSNKMLLYPAAGLAIAASATCGQTWLMDQAPGIGFLYPPGNAPALATGLQKWIDDRHALRVARERSRHYALEALSWKREKIRFLETVQKAVAR